MAQINQNYDMNNDYRQTASTGNKPAARQQQLRIPGYYYPEDKFESPSLKQTILDDPVAGAQLKPFILHPFMTLGTWLGLSYLMNQYTYASSGEYKDSLVAKAANIGDSIQNSKLIQNKPVQTLLGGLSKAKKYGNKLIENNSILRAIKHTPIMPEWNMAKSQMYTHEQEVLQEFIRITRDLKLVEEGPIGDSKEFSLMLDSAEKEMLKNKFNVADIKQIPKDDLNAQVLLKRLGRSEAEIDKIINSKFDTTAFKDKIELLKKDGYSPDEINKIISSEHKNKLIKKEFIKEMGFDGLKEDEIRKILGDDFTKPEYTQKIKNAIVKTKGKIKIGAGQYAQLGPLAKPFGRTLCTNEIYNKLHSISKGAKTETGRAFSKFMQMAYRGFTFGGGKLGALLFIAPGIVEMCSNVKKAGKDEKIGTGVNSLVESISWVFTFPLAAKIMYSLGGIKNAGLDKTTVDNINKLSKEFNDATLTKTFANCQSKTIKTALNGRTEYNKEVYNDVRKAVKDKIKSLKEVKGQNFFVKGFRKIAGFLFGDLGNLNAFNSKKFSAEFIPNWRGKAQFAKDLAGVPTRFIMFMGISGLLGSFLTKGVKAVFGKVYEPEKDEEIEANKKAQKQFTKQDLNERIINQAKLNQMQQNNAITNNTPQRIMEQNLPPYTSKGRNEYSDLAMPTQDVSQDNSTKEYSAQNVDNYNYVPSQNNIIRKTKENNKIDNYSYIPSQECTIKSEKTENSSIKRKYVPSQEGAKFNKTFDNSGLQSALDRADRAEQKAIKVLSGDFSS